MAYLKAIGKALKEDKELFNATVDFLGSLIMIIFPIVGCLILLSK